MQKVLSIFSILFFVANSFAQYEEDFSEEVEFEEESYEEAPPEKISKKEKLAKLRKTKMVEAETEEAVEEEMQLRFGVRGNFGAATTMMAVETYGGNTEAVAGGTDVGLGGFALIPFSSIYFVPEVALQYRTPISDFEGTLKEFYFEGVTLKEIAVEIPLMFRFRYREENLIYLGIGPFVGVVLSSIYDGDGGSLDNTDRAKIDYGLAMELGFRINENFSIDARTLYSAASIGFSEATGIPGDTATLYQIQIGLNYSF